MYLGPIVLATILGVVTPGTVKNLGIKERLQLSNVSTRNSLLEELLWDLIDTAREVMVTGTDDIPVLDPFELDELHLDLSEFVDLPDRECTFEAINILFKLVVFENARLVSDAFEELPSVVKLRRDNITLSHVALKNLTVQHLSTFEVDNLDVSLESLLLQRYRITLDGRIPLIQVQTGYFDLLVNIFGGQVFGNGDMKLDVRNPRLHGHIVVGLRLSIQGIFLTINDCRLSFALEAFEPQITGLFGTPITSEFVSEFLRILIPEFVQHFEEDITEFLSTTVQEVGNEILRDLDLGSLLP